MYALLLPLAGACGARVGSYAPRPGVLQGYQTYAWGPPDNAATGDARLDNNRFFEERVRAAVDRELMRRGFTKVSGAESDLAEPDLIVHYHASVSEKVAGQDLDPGYASDDPGDDYVYRAGTLFVDMVDPHSQRLVWRGWIEGNIDGVVAEQAVMEQRIDEAVARILSRLMRDSAR